MRGLQARSVSEGEFCNSRGLTAPGMRAESPFPSGSRWLPAICLRHHVQPIVERFRRRSPVAASADAGPVCRRRVERYGQGPWDRLPTCPDRHALPGLPRHLLDRHEPSRAASIVRRDEPPQRLGLRARVRAAGRLRETAPPTPRAAVRPRELHPATCVRRARLHAAIRSLLQQRADDARSGRDSA